MKLTVALVPVRKSAGTDAPSGGIAQPRIISQEQLLDRYALVMHIHTYENNAEHR